MAEEQLSLSGARVLVVDDVPENLDLVRRTLEQVGCEVLVATTGERGLTTARRQAPELILLDVMMPGMDGFETCRALKQEAGTRSIPVIFLTALDEIRDLANGFAAGGVDYITKPFRQEEVLLRVDVHLARARLQSQLQEKNRQLEEEIGRRQHLTRQVSQFSEQERERWGLSGFIGQSPLVQAVLEEIELLAEAQTISVLITGESGTGKELIARAIHFGGSRGEESFVAVNCAAIPGELAESSFFGHMRGAFTGAHETHRGYFEQADQGTLFLDEVGDLPLELQAKLLRTLETGRVTPIGGTKERPVNVRIVAATNRDLAGLIGQDGFREDLYFRLAGYTVTLPPLRERPEDIPLLVDHFLRQFSREMGRESPGMSREALQTLQAHRFPGNVRELKNLIEYALIKSRGGLVRPEHLRFIEFGRSGGPTQPAARVEESQDHPANEPLPQEERILAFVRERGSISNPECRDLLTVDLHRASYLLKKLHAEGMLEKMGERRWTRYRLTT